MGQVDIPFGVRSRKGISFQRIDTYSLQTGVMVTYEAKETPFRVRAGRDGVAIQGSLSWMDGAGVAAVMNLFARAIKHHEHLRTYPIGTRQQPLDESVFEKGKAPEPPIEGEVVPVDEPKQLQ